MAKIDEIKSKIQQLVEKYELAKKAGRLKSYTEEETKKDFILPLFQVLGWDVDNKNEVSAEEKISGDRVDYGFYIDGRIKFYLEAKKLEADLHKKEYARQAIKYSWNKGVTWAVLTDFEGIKVFNTQDAKASLGSKLLFSIPYDKYIEQFDELYLLSKESFKGGLIDTHAERIGKKFEKIPVSELLYKDLNWCRAKLTESLKNWNQKVSKHLIDEGVQKLLDRLIFLRVAEDRGIEESTLIPLLREWEASKARNKIPLYTSMIKKFRELDKIYNSNLFTEHPFEKWEEYCETEKVIQKLYGEKGYYEYDFKIMPADVLGSVYENYLGYKLSQSKKGIEVHKDAKKRKEQGIYYTPHFIVEYIVKNALRPILDKCKSIEDLRKIKVLDPACGSGSFLLEAFRLFVEKYKTFQCDDFYTRVQILTNNIYGVDLDMQAVEIARLNLLLAALSTREKLPLLAENIKCGNSLISGTDEKLKKYFGKNFRDKKPFNWEEEFPDVFKQGGFDVIIGNPPYIKEDVNREAFDGLHSSPYYQGKMDIWTMFSCVGIDLLKEEGVLSFIAPSSWISNSGASIFRNKALKEGELFNYVDFGDYKVFENASIQTMIFGYKKGEARESYNINYLKINDRNITQNDLIDTLFGSKSRKSIRIKPKDFYHKNISFNETGNKSLLDKIVDKSNYHLKGEDIGNGIDVLQDFVKQDHLSVLKDENIKRGDGIFILSKQEVEKLNLNEKELFYLKPYYTSKQINRYLSLKNQYEYRIIYADKFFRENIELFSKLKDHLDRFKKILTSVFAPYGLHRAREESFFNGRGIFSLRKTLKPAFSYVDFPCYVTRAFIILNPKDINLKYLTGILNSNLIFFWLKNMGKRQGEQLQIDKEPLLSIPIYLTQNKEKEKILVSLVDTITELNKEFQKTPENSNKWNSIKSEIEKIDKKIDEEVYKLYNLTPEEIKIVEI